MNRRELLLATGSLAALHALGPVPSRAADGTASQVRHSFKPGEPWPDTQGKPIQAHGGSIIESGDSFYRYGENKEFTTGSTEVRSWGVQCYRSKDLYNW